MSGNGGRAFTSFSSSSSKTENDDEGEDEDEDEDDSGVGAASSALTGLYHEMELMVEIKQKDTGATLFRSERESLSGSDLRGAWLCVADLSHADLHGARLNGTCLRTADLRYADLTGADLHGEPSGWETTPAYYALMLIIGSMCLLEEIHKKELIGVGLWALFLIALTTRIWSPKAANLVDADLRDTCLIGADLRGARIDGANFQGAVYDATTKWPARFNARTHGAVLKSSE